MNRIKNLLISNTYFVGFYSCLFSFFIFNLLLFIEAYFYYFKKIKMLSNSYFFLFFLFILLLYPLIIYFNIERKRLESKIKYDEVQYLLSIFSINILLCISIEFLLSSNFYENASIYIFLFLMNMISILFNFVYLYLIIRKEVKLFNLYSYNNLSKKDKIMKIKRIISSFYLIVMYFILYFYHIFSFVPYSYIYYLLYLLFLILYPIFIIRPLITYETRKTIKEMIELNKEEDK